MKAGDRVELHMEKPLRIGMEEDAIVYEGQLYGFDEAQENLIITLADVSLPSISLDAIYQCRIISETEEVSCTGRVKERYHGLAGKTLKFDIKNGFSKINIK